MKFTIVIEASLGLENKTKLIQQISDRMSAYYADKDYGNDVKEIIIRIISVAPEFEWFSTVKKPRYRSYRNYTSRHGVKIVEDCLFSFSLKIDYERFKNQSDEENNKMLASELLGSLSNLDALQTALYSRAFFFNLFGESEFNKLKMNQEDADEAKDLARRQRKQRSIP